MNEPNGPTEPSSPPDYSAASPNVTEQVAEALPFMIEAVAQFREALRPERRHEYVRLRGVFVEQLLRNTLRYHTDLSYLEPDGIYEVHLQDLQRWLDLADKLTDDRIRSAS